MGPVKCLMYLNFTQWLCIGWTMYRSDTLIRSVIMGKVILWMGAGIRVLMGARGFSGKIFWMMGTASIMGICFI